MNLKQFKCVQTLANEGSFSRAADILGITQPSLSQYIKKIERQAGLELFDRTNGDVRLTDAGKAYIDIGRKIMDLEHQLEVQFSDLAGYKTGSLIIGAAPYRTASMMPVVARRFQQLHPGMHLVVREGTTAELEEGMEHGEYDLCLTLLPVDERRFYSELLTEEELVLAVPAAFPQPRAEGTQTGRYPLVDVRELDAMAFVMLTDPQFMQRQLETLAQVYQLRLGTAAVVKSIEAQIEMVRAGVGVALVPSGVERFCLGKEVAFYSFRQPLPKRKVAVIWRKDRALSSVARELKDIIRSILW